MALAPVNGIPDNALAMETLYFVGYVGFEASARFGHAGFAPCPATGIFSPGRLIPYCGDEAGPQSLNHFDSATFHGSHDLIVHVLDDLSEVPPWCMGYKYD